jgi:gluconolactonase
MAIVPKCSLPHYTYLIILFALGVTAFGCKQKRDVSDESNQAATKVKNESIRRVVRLESDSSTFDAIIDIHAKIEVLADGFTWSEGPLWVGDQQMLLFTDVPENTVYSWTEVGGVKEYLKPSGHTGSEQPSKEPGANGLAFTKDGQLLLCQHGDRRIARMESSLRDPRPVFATVVDMWQDKRFNSPNDLVVNSKNQIFFTDPPYGLELQADDPKKEIEFQGVFRRDPDGRVHLLINDLSRPNGIALSPDERTLYVANSDPARAIWMKYALDDHGNAIYAEEFYDATPLVKEMKGLPDGLKVNRKGIIFATGPGGIWIFNQHGVPLGRIETGEATANCALNTDESVLFMCADDYLMRVKLKS